MYLPITSLRRASFRARRKYKTHEWRKTMKFNKETVSTLKEPGVSMAVNAPVTPHAGSGQDASTPLKTGITPINAPANNGDAVQLPAAIAGSFVMLFPVGSLDEKTVSVWPMNGTSDTINTVADDPIDYDSNAVMICTCDTDGNWWCNGTLD
jgi:hypothetical protein